MTSKTIVIVGASLAGVKAAETLRTQGFDGRVILIGEEPGHPYQRPPLSKAYLSKAYLSGEAYLSKAYLSGEADLDEVYLHAQATDQVVFRGDPASREFIAFWLRGGVVVAGMNANVWDVTTPIQPLIHERAHIEPTRLADAEIPLDEFLNDPVSS